MSKLPIVNNLFEQQISNEELFSDLVVANGARLEHIISNGHSSEPDFWYDQADDEWVALLQGTATLEFGEGRISLKSGDSLTIPSRLKHRVSSVSQDAVWLALHYQPRNSK